MKKRYCLPLFFLLYFSSPAQTTPKWDTLKYQKFNYNLIIGVYQGYRNFVNEFQQFKVSDTLGYSKQRYMAESRLVGGIEFTYDKFGFSIGLRSTPPKQSEGKGATNTLNANFNFGGNKWFVQNNLRYFDGFYDSNTGNYDTTIRQTGRYYQRPDFQTLLLRSKFLYFTNHKRFSFRSGFSGNYRQLRSAATWILSGNINYSYLGCDSSFFGYASRPFYGDYGSMNSLDVFGLSLNVGAAGTLVILKGFFLTGLFIVGPEQQWRRYGYSDGSNRLSYISVSGDLRFSIGVNLKRCYFIAFNSNDFSIYNSSFVGISSSSIGGGFTFGWRFRAKPPELYRKFQETRLYKAL